MCLTKLVVAIPVVALALIVLAFYSLDASKDKEIIKRSALRGTNARPKGKETVVLQDKANNCGPAALQMILRHHGVDVSLRRLESESKMSVMGASMQGLKEACELHGLRAEGWKLQWGDLCKAAFPVIVFLRNGHFVVVDSVKRDGFVHLRDPSRGRMRIVKEEFVRSWGGEAITFAPAKKPGR